MKSSILLLFILTCFTLYLGIWIKREITRKNREQRVNLWAKDIDTDMLSDGDKSPQVAVLYLKADGYV
jgi:hypothetical protein